MYRIAPMAAAAASLISAASAQTVEDWSQPRQTQSKGQTYISGGVGAVIAATSSFELSGPDDLLEIETETGTAFAGALGYRQGPFRVELQYADRRTDIEDVTASGIPIATGDGEVNLQALYVNAYYDFNRRSGGLSPYVGFGLGGARVETEALIDDILFFQDSDTVFSGQILAGVTLPLGDAGELFGQYSFYSTGKTRYDDDAIFVEDVGPYIIVREGGRVPSDDYDLNGHLLSVGARFYF